MFLHPTLLMEPVAEERLETVLLIGKVDRAMHRYANVRLEQAKTVRVYNASTAALSFLQVPPSQIPTSVGRAAHLTTGLSVGLGGEMSNTFTVPRKVQQFGTLEPWAGTCDGEDEPAVSTLHPLPSTRLMRLVIYSIHPGNLEFTFHRIIDCCRAGTDVILLEDILKRKYFGTRTITRESEISDILEILKDVL